MMAMPLGLAAADTLVGISVRAAAAISGLVAMALAARVRSRAALDVGLLTVLGSLIGFAPWLWQWPPVIALGWVALTAPVSRRLLGPNPDGTRSWRAWAPLGRPDPATWLLTAVTILASASALLAWAWLADLDTPVRRAFLEQLNELPIWVVAAWLVAFPLVNAAVEEIIYRGVVQGALQQTLGKATWAVLLQAVVFGGAHYHGNPGGFAGVVLATGYGAMLGVIRLRSRGLLAPWIAHVCADITIAVVLLSLLAQQF
ncbi:CPBP family intramembrane metalloprotease [Egibacter rhizosphaerae]|uniref:CPBP family intramembrane metalloprotease n=2 Tax=Egibacter rhizosphaerae TaxID=1670831 RepID=A0A411YC56_9ACTN|nr:CPBP family intramembrane metalloprotease [Egibacter rhizosphaerae]